MKRLTALILTVLTVCSALPMAAFGGRFLDVPDGKWYSEGISFCAANGYMDGVAEGKFDRQSNLTRAMFMTILAKVDGVDLSPYEGESSFGDVKTDGWYTAAIEWAAQNDITGGVGTGIDNKPIFGYKNPITREQMAQFFYVYSAYANEKNALPEITPMPEPPKEYAEGSVTAEEAYNAAIEAIAGIPDHRDVGELQSETQEMVMLEGEYYQSYVASTHDMRYIFIASAEYEMSPAWNWMPIGTRDDYSLDNLGNIDEDMRGDEPGFTPIDLTLRAELSVYTDGERTHSWAREAMEWAVAVGLISGKNDSLLDPRGNCTRAEAAVMIRAYVLTILSACEHDWVDATCLDMGYCTKCDLKQATEIGHDKGSAVCTDVTPCIRCGIDMSAVEHMAPAATCTEASVCEVCNTELAPAFGHDFSIADCVNASRCRVCNLKKENPLGHTTGNGICERCGNDVFADAHRKMVYYLNTKGMAFSNGEKGFMYREEMDGVTFTTTITIRPGASIVHFNTVVLIDGVTMYLKIDLNGIKSVYEMRSGMHYGTDVYSQGQGHIWASDGNASIYAYSGEVSHSQFKDYPEEIAERFFPIAVLFGDYITQTYMNGLSLGDFRFGAEYLYK